MGKVEDEPLVAARHVLAQPVTRKDSRLGTLKLDRSTGELNGSVKWGTRRVRLSLEADDRGGYEAAQLVAGKVVEDQVAWRPRLAEAIVAKMYPLWQEVWREAQKNLSEKQFLAKLKPNSISVDAGGVVEFWFDDSDLFAGHAILVRAMSGGQIESVELA